MYLYTLFNNYFNCIIGTFFNYLFNMLLLFINYLGNIISTIYYLFLSLTSWDVF
jgi:hypothetical protein